MPDATPLTRLPFEVREELCARIRDRQDWRQLNAWLDTLGWGPYKPQNFSHFKKSPKHYVAWLAQQRKLDERSARADQIRRELAADGFTTLDRAMLDLVDNLADPELSPIKAASALASLKSAVTSSARVELEKKRLQLAKQAAALEQEKFRFKVAEQFLAWFNDARAKAIAESKAPRTDQIQQLINLMEQMEQ